MKAFLLIVAFFTWMAISATQAVFDQAGSFRATAIAEIDEGQ